VREKIARMFDIAPATVVHAVTVVRKGIPELIAAVERDEMAVSAASNLARCSPAEQRRALGKDLTARRARAAVQLKSRIDKMRKQYPNLTAASVADRTFSALHKQKKAFYHLFQVTTQTR
jgi:hypothetical protein